VLKVNPGGLDEIGFEIAVRLFDGCVRVVTIENAGPLMEAKDPSGSDELSAEHIDFLDPARLGIIPADVKACGVLLQVPSVPEEADDVEPGPIVTATTR